MANGNTVLIRRVLAVLALICAVVSYIVPMNQALDLAVGLLAIAILL